MASIRQASGARASPTSTRSTSGTSSCTAVPAGRASDRRGGPAERAFRRRGRRSARPAPPGPTCSRWARRRRLSRRRRRRPLDGGEGADEAQFSMRCAPSQSTCAPAAPAAWRTDFSRSIDRVLGGPLGDDLVGNDGPTAARRRRVRRASPAAASTTPQRRGRLGRDRRRRRERRRRRWGRRRPAAHARQLGGRHHRVRRRVRRRAARRRRDRHRLRGAGAAARAPGSGPAPRDNGTNGTNGTNGSNGAAGATGAAGPWARPVPAGPTGAASGRARGPGRRDRASGPRRHANCVVKKPSKKSKSKLPSVKCTVAPAVKASAARLVRNGKTVARGTVRGGRLTLRPGSSCAPGATRWSSARSGCRWSCAGHSRRLARGGEHGSTPRPARPPRTTCDHRLVVGQPPARGPEQLRQHRRVRVEGALDRLAPDLREVRWPELRGRDDRLVDVAQAGEREALISMARGGAGRRGRSRAAPGRRRHPALQVPLARSTDTAARDLARQDPLQRARGRRSPETARAPSGRAPAVSRPSASSRHRGGLSMASAPAERGDPLARAHAAPSPSARSAPPRAVVGDAADTARASRRTSARTLVAPACLAALDTRLGDHEEHVTSIGLGQPAVGDDRHLQRQRRPRREDLQGPAEAFLGQPDGMQSAGERRAAPSLALATSSRMWPSSGGGSSPSWRSRSAQQVARARPGAAARRRGGRARPAGAPRRRRGRSRAGCCRPCSMVERLGQRRWPRGAGSSPPSAQS